MDDSDGDIFGSNRVDRVGGNRAITGQDLSRKRAPAPPDGTKDIFWTDWKISNVAITLLCSRGPLLKLHFTPKYWLWCKLKRSLFMFSTHHGMLFMLSTYRIEMGSPNISFKFYCICAIFVFVLEWAPLALLNLF